MLDFRLCNETQFLIRPYTRFTIALTRGFSLLLGSGLGAPDPKGEKKLSSTYPPYIVGIISYG